MENLTEMNADVRVVIESGGVTQTGDDDSGVFTVHIRTRIDFNSPDLSQMIERLSALDPDAVGVHISTAIAAGLTELIGPDIADGGECYVQDH